MEVLVLKTNLTSQKEVKKLNPLFKSQVGIRRWSVDTEDIDKVMRIEADQGFDIEDAVKLVQALGFNARELDC